MRKALVTGSAGFIGFWVCKSLLKQGWSVIGVDAIDPYYDVNLKLDRERHLAEFRKYQSVHARIEEPGLMKDLLVKERPDVLIHLAAQAGVRHSIENPEAYLASNVVGTFEILEACRQYKPQHLLIASTSSAYGANKSMPYHEGDKADYQMSFYAATKKATENFSHSYSHLYNIPVTIFRFFTVYGPWGRPDMALFKFTDAIISERPVDLYNHGAMTRDFTYVEDLAKAICLLADQPPALGPDQRVIANDSLSPVAPWRVVNIGNSRSVQLRRYLEAIETCLNKKAQVNSLPMQAGDVEDTCADTTLLFDLIGYKPQTEVEAGVASFIDWYKTYYKRE